jgi:hypothetical protein
VFPNLGGDAIMVVPCPFTSPSAYGHLAAFVRQAPEAQWHALWRGDGSARGTPASVAQHRGRRCVLATRTTG